MPTVFVSYSHESTEHTELVLALVDSLRRDGLNVVVDQDEHDAGGNWPRWTERQVLAASFVLCICTSTYCRRFDGTDEASSRGVAWEATHIRNAIYDTEEIARKFVAVCFSADAIKQIPSILKGVTRFELGTTSSYDALRSYLLQGPPSTAATLQSRKSTRLQYQLMFEAGGVRAIPAGNAPRLTDAETQLLGERVVANDCAIIRLTFESLGDDHYRVAIQSRVGGDLPFQNRPLEVALGSDGLPGWNSITNHPLVAPIVHQQADTTPIRIQLRFAASAKVLDRIDWESLPLRQRPISQHPHIVLSRSFVLVDGEAPEIRVSPKSELQFSIIDVATHPAQAEASYQWNQPVVLPVADPDMARSFGSVLRYTGLGGPNLTRQLGITDVLYFPLLVGTASAQGHPSLLAMPNAQGDVQAVSAYQFIATLRDLPERPIVIFLAPSSWDATLANGLFDYCARVASDCASAGVASTISLCKDVSQHDWHRFLHYCAAALRQHGIVDAAVATALQRVPSLTGRVRLHLRNKSARLWYRSGLVTPGSEPVQWKDLRETLAQRAGKLCAVVGPGIDRDLKLSRRVIAREMALAHGFSLNHKDEHSLARVAEYIRVRGKPASAGSTPAHVQAFLDHVRTFLLDHVIAPSQQQEAQHWSIEKLVEAAGAPRLANADSPYRRLGRLRASCFLTTNFHGLIEAGIRQAKREPSIASFRDKRTVSVLEIDVQRPIVYHAYGTFSDPNQMALAESDHLDFFSEFVNSQSSAILKRVRSLALNGTLLFVGFHPESWEFRVLFAALSRMPGNKMGMRNVHIAVQVDPEDDQIIDPNGARHFYEGLFAPLGHHVYIYWGRPEQFLSELESNVGEIFHSEIDAGQKEAL